MTDPLSILFHYIEELPPSTDAQKIIDNSDVYYQRLCQLTTFDEADDIWNAAMKAGIAACSSDFHRGVIMGIKLWEQTHPSSAGTL